MRGTGSGDSETGGSASEVRCQTPATVSRERVEAAVRFRTAGGQSASAPTASGGGSSDSILGMSADSEWHDSVQWSADERGATIALMGKFKPVRAKTKASRAAARAVSCIVIMVIAGMLLVMLFLYFVMSNADR